MRARYICPLTMKEMSGSLPFVALRSCGCVFSEAGLRSVVAAEADASGEAPITPPASDGEREDAGAKASPAAAPRMMPCPNCNTPFDPAGISGRAAWLPLNPRPEVQETLLAQLLAERAAAKLAKADKMGKKRKAGRVAGEAGGDAVAGEDTAKRSKTGSGSAAPPASASQSHLSSKVQAELAALEQARTAGGMSRAVQSIYAGKGEPKRGATNDFFTRTFTRVSEGVRRRRGRTCMLISGGGFLVCLRASRASLPRICRPSVPAQVVSP